MAFDPSRAFSASSGKAAAILCAIALFGVLAAFAIRVSSYQKKFPRPPSSGEHPAKNETEDKGD